MERGEPLNTEQGGDRKSLRGTALSIDMREGSRTRAALRLLLGTRPQRVGVFLLRWPQHHAARSTCAASFNVRSSPLGANTVCKSRNSFADALFTQGLMALMQPIICCVRAQSAREFVREFSGGATPHRSGVAQS